MTPNRTWRALSSHAAVTRFITAPPSAKTQPAAAPSPSVGGNNGSKISIRRPWSAIRTAVAFRELGRSAPAYGSSPLTKSWWTMSHLDRADSVRATLWSFLSSDLARGASGAVAGGRSWIRLEWVVHHKWMLYRAELRELGERRYRHRGDALAAADEAHSLAGRELHVHGARLDADRVGQALSHIVAEGRKLRLLARDGGVHVRRRDSRTVQHRAHRSQQFDRVGVAPALVGVREVLADVAHAGRAEQRVDHRVGEHVRVRVAGEAALRLRDLHAAEHQAAARLQPVRVPADAGRGHPSGSSRRDRRSNTAISLTPSSPSHSTARSYS